MKLPDNTPMAIISALAAILLSLACGCAKITVILDCDGTHGNSYPQDTSGTLGNNLVNFHASVESMDMTKSMSPIPANTKVTIYAFHGSTSDATSTAPMARGIYVAQQAGTLSGTNGYKMQLSNGTFDFYAVSINSTDPAPTFSNGILPSTKNGIDYLWWGTDNYDVNGAQVTVPIVLNHSATQVSFEIDAGEGMVLQEIVSATISVPKEGASMDLSNGIIEPATEYASQPAKMGINGMRLQYTMLPLKTDTPMSLELSIKLNYDPTPRSYKVEVPVPDGELDAGKSYRFKAIINADNITFPEVGITDWVDVDETGNPLYPH